MEQTPQSQFALCPLCRNKMPVGSLNRHLIQLHMRGHSELLQDVLNALALDPDSETLKCIHCNSMIRKGRLPGHFLRVHSDLYLKSTANDVDSAAQQNPKQGKTLKTVTNVRTGFFEVPPSEFESLLRSSRLQAVNVERCNCRKLVAFVGIEPGRLKAFDVDQWKRLTGAHSCDGPKSESIHAFQGGAIDSNRRKH